MILASLSIVDSLEIFNEFLAKNYMIARHIVLVSLEACDVGLTPFASSAYSYLK
jgi:hypothetical protein